MSENVVPLYQANCLDVAAMARKFADDVEAGVYGEVPAVVVVAETEADFEVFGWGDVEALKAIGLLAIGTAKMAGVEAA